MKYNYILKVWFATILVAPFILAISTLISDKQSGSEAFEFILLEVLIGFVFSFPALLLGLLLIYITRKKIIKESIWKIILISFSVIAEIITFLILFGPRSYNTTQLYGILRLSIVYGVCTIALGIIFRVNPD